MVAVLQLDPQPVGGVLEPSARAAAVMLGAVLGDPDEGMDILAGGVLHPRAERAADGLRVHHLGRPVVGEQRVVGGGVGGDGGARAEPTDLGVDAGVAVLLHVQQVAEGAPLRVEGILRGGGAGLLVITLHLLALVEDVV